MAKLNYVLRENLPYVYYLPEGYSSSPDKKWPLCIFLCGAGERGTDLEKITIHGYPKHVSQGRDYPFIMVAPQIDNDNWWGQCIDDLEKFLDEMLREYNVDPDRVYLTGLSMGGSGTWKWALDHPERFAAIAPMATRAVETEGKLNNVPVWVFQGDMDNYGPPEEYLKMIEDINKSGGKAKITIFEGVGHGCWHEPYDSMELVDWMLTHKRNS